MKRILWDLEWAWQQVWPRIGQLTVTVFVIALGVALSAAVMLAGSTLGDTLEESMSSLAGRAQLQVSAHGGADFDESVLPIVQETAGVSAAAPLLFKKVFLDDSGVPFRLVGVDMLDDATVRVYRADADANTGIDDPLIFLNQPDSVLLPRSFLRTHGFDRGDRVEIQSPNGKQTLTVRGVIEDEGIGSAFGGELGIMDIFSAQATLVAEGKISQIDVRIEETADLDEVAARLKEALPTHLLVESIEAQKAKIRDLISGFRFMMDFMSGLGLVLAAVITGNRLSTIYQARMWEIGAMRALGASPRGLVRSFLAEALVIAAIGCGIGIPLSILFAEVLIQPITETTTLNFKQLGMHLSQPSGVVVTPAPLLLASGAGVLSALIAAWLPARRSTRVPVHEALSKGRSRQAVPESQWKRWARVVLPPFALVALALQAAGFSGAGVLAVVLVPISAALLITPGLRLASRIVGDRLGAAAGVGLEDQSLVPSRATGAAGVIVAGIGFVGFVAIAGASFERYVVGSLMQTRNADLVVDSGFNAGGSASGENVPRLSDSVVDALQAIPGVRFAGAGVSARAYDPDMGLLGIDPVRFRDAEFGDWKVLPGALPNVLERAANGEVVLVDETLASTSKLAPGDTLPINTPLGEIETLVGGITSARSFQSPRGDVVLSRHLYRDSWNDHTVTRVFLLLSEGSSANEVRTRILEQLGERFDLRVVKQSDLREWFADTVREGFATTNWIMWLALIVAIVGTGDALSSTIVERTRELGAMRALGFSPRQIGAMVIAQAAAIGLVGATLASFVALALGSAFLDGFLPTALGWEVSMHVTTTSLLIPALLGIAASVSGALLAAARAATVSPIEALRYE